MDSIVINNLSNLYAADHGATINIYSQSSEFPLIRAGAVAPCKPYIEGSKRAADLANIDNMLKTGQALWVYGEGGIGKTELLLKYAEGHSEYEYIFIQYKGSINQTVSQNLFYLPGFEMKGMELSDVVRYQQNLAVMTLYHHQLKRENRNLVLVIDNYVSENYEKSFREMTELNIDNEFSGDKNDLNTIQDLHKTGILVVLTTRTTPEHSDAYLTYEVKEMDETDLFEVIKIHFDRINPFLERSGVKEKLLNLIRIAESNTVFITIMALAMQTSNLSPIEALDSLTRRLETDHAYLVRYGGDKSARLQDHMEKVLGFMRLSYQDKQVLGTLTMLPDTGIDYDLYQKITISGAVQLDQKREKIIERFINNHIVFSKQKQDVIDSKNGGQSIYMHSLVSEHAQRVLINDDKKFFLNLIEQNWINKILHFFDRGKIGNINYQDKDYIYLSQIADVCSSTESKLQFLLEYLGDQYEERIIDFQRRLLFKAAELSHANGNVKDAVEYIERAISIEGPSREDLETLRRFTNLIGIILWEGGKYSKAKHYYLIDLQILNDRNDIFYEEIEDVEVYDEQHISELEDAILYGATFNNLAMIYIKLGNYAEGLKFCQKALAIREKVLGPEHPDTAMSYNNMAGVYEGQGNYAEELKYYQKALAINEKVLGPEHPDTVTTYSNMAGVYSAQGNYAESLKYYQKALAIREKVLGSEHIDTAAIYSNITGVYIKQGNYEEAQRYNLKALAIREKVLGSEHPDTAKTYDYTAAVYRVQGNYIEALKFCQKALAIHKKILGPEHPDTATIYNNMAGVYEGQGNYTEALKYYHRALIINEKVLGMEHPFTAMTYGNMATVYRAQGYYSEALKYYHKELAISEKVLGPEHPSTAMTYANMAMVYYAQGNYAKALKYNQKALVIIESVLGPEHPDTATTYSNMAGVYSAQGNYAEALKYYDKVLAIYEKVLGMEHPYTATAYHNIAEMYKGQGNYTEALEYYHKELEINEKVLGSEHPNIVKTYNNMGALYYKRHDYEKAKDYFVRSLPVLEKTLGPDHPYTKNTKKSLDLVYEELKNQ